MYSGFATSPSPSSPALPPSRPFLSMAWGSGVPKEMETVDQCGDGSSGYAHGLPGLTCRGPAERASVGLRSLPKAPESVLVDSQG